MLNIDAGETMVVRLCLSNSEFKQNDAFKSFDAIFAQRKRETDEFYSTIIPHELSDDAKNVMRQGFGGMLWSKQFITT